MTVGGRRFEKFMQHLLADHPSVALVAFSKGFARYEQARQEKDYAAATRHLHEALRYVPAQLQGKTLVEMIKSVDNPDESGSVAAVIRRIAPRLSPQDVVDIICSLIIDNIDQRHRLHVGKYIADSL